MLWRFLHLYSSSPRQRSTTSSSRHLTPTWFSPPCRTPICSSIAVDPVYLLQELQLVGMSILLILLSSGLGCYILTPLRDRHPHRSTLSQKRLLLATSPCLVPAHMPCCVTNLGPHESCAPYLHNCDTCARKTTRVNSDTILKQIMIPKLEILGLSYKGKRVRISSFAILVRFMPCASHFLYLN